MAAAKTSEDIVESVNVRCEELESIVSALETRIAELETNLNTDTRSPRRIPPDGKIKLRK
jgi:prefoldin subunit 5